MSERKKPQDCIPEDFIMKRILDDYRRISEHIDAARSYGLKMERENANLKQEIARVKTANRKHVQLEEDKNKKIKYMSKLLRSNRIAFNLNDATDPQKWGRLSKKEISLVLALRDQYLKMEDGDADEMGMINYIYSRFV